MTGLGRQIPPVYWLWGWGLLAVYWVWIPRLQASGPIQLPNKSAPIVRSLSVIQAWPLEPPRGERFDASALLRLPDGTLLTVNDKQAGVYRIEFPSGDGPARLILIPGVFDAKSLHAATGRKSGTYDLEGLARDDQGRLYVCDESSRRVFRHDPLTQTTEALNFDWSPVRRWFSTDGNASWEGIAFGGGKLYLANERSVGRIVVTDPEAGRVLRSFSVAPPGRAARDVHYSDLSWFDGRLWVLCRESHCVLQVDPERERVEASYEYGAIERDRRYGYLNPLPYGFVEGLAVTADEIWLVVDNNGVGRISDVHDVRPSLWKCARPVLTTGRQPDSADPK